MEKNSKAKCGNQIESIILPFTDALYDDPLGLVYLWFLKTVFYFLFFLIFKNKENTENTFSFKFFFF